MTSSEKVAYLKGLANGLGLDTETKEGKLIAGIIDILEDMAHDISELDENALDLSEEIDALSDDLADVEEIVYDEDDGECDDEELGGRDHYRCCAGDSPAFYEVTCPTCDNTITVDEEVLELGAIDCPNCGEALEFDFDEDDDEDYDGELELAVELSESEH